jgi:hypothetical protein
MAIAHVEHGHRSRQSVPDQKATLLMAYVNSPSRSLDVCRIGFAQPVNTLLRRLKPATDQTRKCAIVGESLRRPGGHNFRTKRSDLPDFRRTAGTAAVRQSIRDEYPEGCGTRIGSKAREARTNWIRLMPGISRYLALRRGLVLVSLCHVLLRWLFGSSICTFGRQNLRNSKSSSSP